jgi:hypothetical protein
MRLLGRPRQLVEQAYTPLGAWNGGRMDAVRRPVAIVLAMLLAAVALYGCTSGPPKGPVAAGYKTGSLGGAEVVGYLEREADTWAVFDIAPGPSSVYQPQVLATLKPGSVDEGGIEALLGRYVWAAGRVARRTGPDKTPEISVDGIDVAQEQ